MTLGTVTCRIEISSMMSQRGCGLSAARYIKQDPADSILGCNIGWNMHKI